VECQEWVWGLASSDNSLNFGLKKGCTNPGRQVARATVVCTSPVGPHYEIGFVAPCGDKNFEVARRFWEDMCTSG
jgi:hypothetical protein